MKKKHYVFRPYGQDEGAVALLTEAEVNQIQDRINAITIDDLNPPYYIYEMDSSTAAGIHETLDECEVELAAEKRERANRVGIPPDA
jgi:hypothetical protein